DENRCRAFPVAPAKLAADDEVRSLGRAQSVELCGRSARLHCCVREARSEPELPGAATDSPGRFDPANPHGIDILPLPETSGDETDAREESRSMPKGHIGDRVGQAVHESGQLEVERAVPITRPSFDSGHPLRNDL